MVSETGEQTSVQLPQLQIVEHVGNLPVVVTALQQLGTLYGYTKEYNGFVKFSLDKAENGLRFTSAMAAPVVNKLPVSTLDSFAVGQMEKLEQLIPLITKPTPEVMAGAGQLYNATVKPAVDRVSGLKSQVQRAATTSQDTVRAIGQKGKDTLGSVAEVNRQGIQKVSEFSKAKVTSMASYGESKLVQLLETKYGMEVAKHLKSALDRTEGYVDFYLPEAQENKSKDALNDTMLASKPWAHAGHVGKKAGRRLYAQSLQQMEKLRIRSMEMVNKFNFTVDLLDYAKTQLDSGKNVLQKGMVKSKDKMWSVWEQVNQSNEDTLSEETSNDKMSMESRLIATARHLITNIKHGMDSLSSVTGYLPSSIHNMFNTTRTAVNNVYKEFSNVKSLDDVKTATIVSARNLIGSVKTFSESVLSYTASFSPSQKMKKTEEQIQMEDLATNPKQDVVQPETPRTDKEENHVNKGSQQDNDVKPQ